MRLPDYARTLLRYWQSLLLGIICALLLTAVASQFAPRNYTASADVSFGLSAGLGSSEAGGQALYPERQMKTYKTLATSEPVLRAVAAESGVSGGSAALQRKIDTSLPADTTILTITLTDESAERAASLANLVAKHVSEVAVSLSPVLNTGNHLLAAKTLNPATPPAAPSSADRTVIFMLAPLLAIAFGVLAAAIAMQRDPRIRTAADVPAPGIMALVPPMSEACLRDLAEKEITELCMKALSRAAAPRMIALTPVGRLEAFLPIVEGLKSQLANLGLPTAIVWIESENGDSLLAAEADSRTPAAERSYGERRVPVSDAIRHAKSLRERNHAHNAVSAPADSAKSWVNDDADIMECALLALPPISESPGLVALLRTVDITLMIVSARSSRRAEVKEVADYLAECAVSVDGWVLCDASRQP